MYADDGSIIGISQPDDPNICVPNIIYCSPFQNYHPQKFEKLKSWRKANEAVANQAEHGREMNMSKSNATVGKKHLHSYSDRQMKGSK